MTTKTRTIRRPQQIEESKMQGYFMISRRDASVAIANKLTGSQCRLWLYLMIVDPFADHTSGGEIKYHDLPSIAEIAIAVGSSPDTVDKDLRKLRKLGLYEYRTVTVQGHNSTAANARAEAERLKSKSKSSSKPSQDKGSAYLSKDGAYLSKDGAYLSKDGAYLSGDGAYLSGDGEPKPLSDKDFGASSDQSNYSNFIKTLSEGERESFLEFGKKKAEELKNPPVQLPLKWIETHFEELKALWEKYEPSTGSTHCGAANSTKVLNFENWEGSTHEGQYHTLMNLGLVKFCENTTSSAWYEWARAKHPERFINVPE